MENTDAFYKMENVKQTSQSLPEQIAEQIRKMIIEQRLGIGERLPNEFELAQQLNVGRGTIREAVKILVARNVLEIQRGKGTFIAHNTGIVEDPFGFDYMDDEEQLARELYSLRLHLEPWFARLAAQNATEEDVRQLWQTEMEVESLMREGKNYLPADQQFHLCIAQCTKNRVLPMMIPVITYSIHLFGKQNSSRMIEESIRTHREIIEAIENHDPNQAEEKMQEHLKLNESTVPALQKHNI